MSNNESTSTKVITVRLRIPALVLMAVILVGGLVWAFVLGVMVGRGQINDQLEALRPQAQNEVADKTADEIESLIKAEDLKYQESLRQNQTPAALAEAARNDSAQSRPPVQPPVPQQTQQPAQASSAQKYNYLYQVASYAKEDQAKEMQAKLKAKGVDAQVETKVIQNTSMFRVLISFQGDESSVQSMQDMLKKDFKINNILPRGKTPLSR